MEQMDAAIDARNHAKQETLNPAIELCELGDTDFDGLESFSPFCIKVHRALRLAGMRYTSRRGQAPAEFSDLNPTGQVPVLLIDGKPLADSTAICARLHELGGGLLPKEPAARANALLWEELADTSLNGFVVAARWADERNWPRARDVFFASAPAPARAAIGDALCKQVVSGLVARDVWRAGPERCWRRFHNLLDALDVRAPETGFWIGTEPSVADVAIFGQLHSLRCDLTPWQRDEIAERSRLSAYLDRVNSRTSSPAS